LLGTELGKKVDVVTFATLKEELRDAILAEVSFL